MEGVGEATASKAAGDGEAEEQAPEDEVEEDNDANEDDPDVQAELGALELADLRPREDGLAVFTIGPDPNDDAESDTEE